ncbi:MAG: transglycosylase SLT domain-containing protein [Spirochaetales bacterium]|nr:transglycosylase SLT domain-containing protein [Spirochaetales bacterium]
MNKSLFCIRNKFIRGLPIRNFIILILILPIILTCTQSISIGNNKDNSDNYSKLEYELPELNLENREGLPVQLAKTEDLGLYIYRNPLTRSHIVSYFDQLTSSPQITDIILRHADRNNIPVSLAFSLAFAESSYNPKAVNNNSTSIDRGLFQLNSKSFPDLTETDFFDPEINARYGLSYLRKCIDRGGNEIVGLAMYNAGSGRVTGSGTPKMTLDYIAKIIDYREDIDAFIIDSMVQERSIVESGQDINSVRYVLNTRSFHTN